MTDTKLAETFNKMKLALATLEEGLPGDMAIKEAEASLSLLADRFARPHSPLLVAMCGPTGAGKSHIFNFLAGGDVSPSSYKRPSTIAPVLAAPNEQLYELNKKDFLPKYHKVESLAGASFADVDEDRLYLVSLKNPSWDWPKDLAVIDTPDFDSVRAVNQLQADDMARRADAIILVTHQAKYADQSTWDFMAGENGGRRPLLIILNRVTAKAAVDDFKERLGGFGLGAPVLPWPEETAVGQVTISVARKELTDWLTELGAHTRALTAAGGRDVIRQLSDALKHDLLPRVKQSEGKLQDRLSDIRRMTTEWMDNPREHMSLSLPGETKDALMKNIGEVVRRSDLWDKPRRLISKPFAIVGEHLKKMFGGESGPEKEGKKIAAGLNEASREALVTAVRNQARALAEASGLPSPQPELDLSTGEIRKLHQEMTERLDAWLKEETAKLLAGLPLGQRAVFYFVQLMHIGLVLGLQIQTGGLPGTEVLVGGALGPVISKLTGVVISRENLTAFESRAVARHQQELAAIFHEQGGRYEARLKSELEVLASGRDLEGDLEKLEKEAGRLWD
ncbi:hypothetical protein C4J81_11180 [Deltaproteobacteria bacterium Smac51]|nr:hypothetical protein C4J81_11180 [Deltaproteobacteria bacterium Smac51]